MKQYDKHIESEIWKELCVIYSSRHESYFENPENSSTSANNVREAIAMIPGTLKLGNSSLENIYETHRDAAIIARTEIFGVPDSAITHIFGIGKSVLDVIYEQKRIKKPKKMFTHEYWLGGGLHVADISIESICKKYRVEMSSTPAAEKTRKQKNYGTNFTAAEIVEAAYNFYFVARIGRGTIKGPSVQELIGGKRYSSGTFRRFAKDHSALMVLSELTKIPIELFYRIDKGDVDPNDIKALRSLVKPFEQLADVEKYISKHFKQRIIPGVMSRESVKNPQKPTDMSSSNLQHIKINIESADATTRTTIESICKKYGVEMSNTLPLVEKTRKPENDGKSYSAIDMVEAAYNFYFVARKTRGPIEGPSFSELIEGKCYSERNFRRFLNDYSTLAVLSDLTFIPVKLFYKIHDNRVEPNDIKTLRYLVKPFDQLESIQEHIDLYFEDD